MKKIVFVLGILGSIFVQVTTGMPSAVPTIALRDDDAGLATVLNHSTPPVTDSSIELIDDFPTMALLAAQIEELQRQVSSLTSNFTADVSLRKKHVKRAASAARVSRLTQQIDDRFEKQEEIILDLMESLSEISSKVQAEKVGAGDIERLSYMVEHRFGLQDSCIRASALAFNKLFFQVREMRGEIATLKAQNEQLQQQVADLTQKLADSKPN